MLIEILNKHGVCNFNLIEKNSDPSDDIIYPSVEKFLKLKEEYNENIKAR